MIKTKINQRLMLMLCAFISTLLLSQSSFAQKAGTHKVTGTVLDGKTAAPLSTVSVVVKGANRGTSTDDNGHFTIEVADGNVIQISHLGYAGKDIAVKPGMSIIKVELLPSQNVMEDVVVIGYGKIKKTDLSSAQVTVTSADIQKTVNTTLDQALQGRAANVNVTANSGQPGAAPSVIIRGLNSLTGNSQPLYVVDGVQFQPSNPPADDPNNRPRTFTNFLSNINPDDIETINVLQGPSATAIYGSAGGNGVVLITTKRGKAGDTKIGVNGLWTLQDQPDHIDVMNLPQYAAFRNEVQKAGGTASDPSFQDPTVLGPGTDWQNELFRKTMLQKYGLSLSGGNEKTSFFLSGEYFTQQGIAPGSGFDRASARINIDNQTKRWLHIGANLNAAMTKEKVSTSNAGIIDLAIRQNPSIPVKNPDGSWGGPTNTQYQFSNPVALANINNDYNTGTSIIAGINADITFTKGLVWHNEVNGSTNFTQNYIFHPGYNFNGYIVPSTSAYSYRAQSNNYWWSFNSRLQYDKQFGAHSISAMIAHEAQSWGNSGVTGQRTNYVSYANQELSGGVQNTSIANSSKGSGAKESYFGRLSYIYQDKYIVQGTLRRDGSSNFGPDNRWGTFPAISAAWRISRESFMQNASAVNDLKLRLEYGQSGNSNAGGYYSTLQSVPISGSTGFLSSNFANPKMHWETDETFNVGFDLKMFNSRLEVIADAYVKNVKDLLVATVGPYYIGGDVSYSPGYIQWPTTNNAAMRNKGLGVTINSVNIQNKQFTWKTGFNLSIDRNKITKLPTPINLVFNSTQAQFTSVVGQPASMITGYIADGLFQNYNDIVGHAVQTSNGVMTVSPTQGSWVGDVKFRDISGPKGTPDGIIDQNDRIVMGNPWPKWTFGFNNSFNYKNFDLNIFIIGSLGNDLLDYERYLNEIPGNTGVYGNYYSAVSNFARPSSYNVGDSSTVTLLNPGYNIARIAPGNQNGNNRMSQWYIEDGSYVKIKNISLTYTFPQRMVSKYVKGVRVAVNVQNVYTFTKYKGYDPEIGPTSYGGVIMAGMDMGKYPSTRMYSASINVDL